MVNIGYFVERATVKDGNKNANMQFSGGILVPSKIEPSHFHDALSLLRGKHGGHRDQV